MNAFCAWPSLLINVSSLSGSNGSNWPVPVWIAAICVALSGAITAYSEYALEGYELDVIDYLLKQISFDRFAKAVKKASDYIVLKEKKEAETQATYLFVKSEKRIEKIELADILYIESMGNYINIITTHKKIVAYLTLKGIESKLPADQFIKVHQSFLIPLARIEFIEGNRIKLKDASIPIGRNYRDAVMKLVDERLLKR